MNKHIHNLFDSRLEVIDTHAHIDDFPILNAVIERAKKSGVVAIIAVGTGPESNKKLNRLSRSYSNYVFPALGIHPWEIELNAEAEIDRIRNEIEDCVAVGEIGLDYWIKIDKEKQRSVFKKLLELAVENDKPVSIHTRGAWEDAYHLVEESGIKKAVFHWYSGPFQILEKILEKGYFISATPAVEYSKAHIEAIKKTPLENLLLETDSPVKYKGVEAEPATVIKTLNLVSELKKVTQKTVADKTTRNAIELFKIKI